jgi:hypothetical protein
LPSSLSAGFAAPPSSGTTITGTQFGVPLMKLV